MTDGTVHGARQEGTAWHRWHHMLAAALLFLTGTLFATVAWFHAVTLPDWLWLALVALASLALAARPPAAATLVETAAGREARDGGSRSAPAGDPCSNHP
jgi:hypothetical protein